MKAKLIRQVLEQYQRLGADANPELLHVAIGAPHGYRSADEGYLMAEPGEYYEAGYMRTMTRVVGLPEKSGHTGKVAVAVRSYGDKWRPKLVPLAHVLDGWNEYQAERKAARKARDTEGARLRAAEEEAVARTKAARDAIRALLGDDKVCVSYRDTTTTDPAQYAVGMRLGDLERLLAKVAEVEPKASVKQPCPICGKSYHRLDVHLASAHTVPTFATE